MCLILREARGTGGAEIVVTNIDIRCGHTAGVICYLVQAADCVCGGGNPNVASKRYGLLRLKEG